MATINNKHKGALAELRATTWLLERGYEVFRNVSQHGPIDIVAIREGETLLLDVKTASERAVSHPSMVKDVHRAMGVRLFLVTPTECIITDLPGPKEPAVCSRCGVEFTPRQRDQLYCSPKCKARAGYQRLKLRVG